MIVIDPAVKQETDPGAESRAAIQRTIDAAAESTRLLREQMENGRKEREVRAGRVEGGNTQGLK